ncbi:MAG: NAD(P)H-dependent dehydrogenase/reductase, partial [Desulfuromonadaceae bacterium]
WVQVRLRPHDDSTDAESYVRSELNIPEQMRVNMIVGIGHPAEEKPGHPRAELPAERIHLEQFDYTTK